MSGLLRRRARAHGEPGPELLQPILGAGLRRAGVHPGRSGSGPRASGPRPLPARGARWRGGCPSAQPPQPPLGVLQRPGSGPPARWTARPGRRARRRPRRRRPRAGLVAWVAWSTSTENAPPQRPRCSETVTIRTCATRLGRGGPGCGWDPWARTSRSWAAARARGLLRPGRTILVQSLTLGPPLPLTPAPPSARARSRPGGLPVAERGGQVVRQPEAQAPWKSPADHAPPGLDGVDSLGPGADAHELVPGSALLRDAGAAPPARRAESSL